MLFVGQVLLKSGVVEVHIAQLGKIRLFTSSIRQSSGTELLEFHDVACQSACLIGEDVFNLTKFLV